MFAKLGFEKRAILVLIFLMVARIFAMIYIPLNDSTEARYGEITRLMDQSGDWITLMHREGEPFLAKPPLAIWLSCVAVKIFGLNVFALRIPALLLSLGVILLIGALVRERLGQNHALRAALILLGSFYFLLDAGTVMTDPALLFCITLMWVSFWRALICHSQLAGYGFFLGVALGLLAKGPVALVIAGLPLFLWVLRHRLWYGLATRLPWFSGILLVLLLALPWYVLAEIKTPGFLNYFIVGEHLKRFLQPGWAGDKYGYAHSAPYGMIWVYFIIGILPWSFVGLRWLYVYYPQLKSSNDHPNDGLWSSYWLYNMMIPLLFFSLARNIIYPYVFPCLPPFAILFTELLYRFKLSARDESRLVFLSMISGFVFVMATLMFIYFPSVIAKSQSGMIAAWRQLDPNPNDDLLYWDRSTLYSAQFYSRGHVKASDHLRVFCSWLAASESNYIVLNSQSKLSFPQSILSELELKFSIKVLSENYSLYHGAHLNCAEFNLP